MTFVTAEKFFRTRWLCCRNYRKI